MPISPISPTPPEDSSSVSNTSPLKIPEAFQKAGFTDSEYKKFYQQFMKDCADAMNKISKKIIENLKEQRRQIESGEQ